jgi:formylmethanofuran dehydrogenase subunit E
MTWEITLTTKQTKWNIPFIDEVETISLTDPLAYVLGSQAQDEPFVFSYGDAVKMAGHSCPAVSGAYKMTAIALRALYGSDTPVRGEIRVLVKGAPEQLAYGPQAQIIMLITGAAPETGFKGLGGKYSRLNKLAFDRDDFQFSTFLFQRADTGKAVKIVYNPSCLGEDERMTTLTPKVIKGIATVDEKTLFTKLWQAKIKKILLDSDQYPELFEVEELKDFVFPEVKNS